VKNPVREHGASSMEKAILAIHPRSEERGILAFSRKELNTLITVRSSTARDKSGDEKSHEDEDDFTAAESEDKGCRRSNPLAPSYGTSGTPFASSYFTAALILFSICR
jgi:hypothetical protein